MVHALIEQPVLRGADVPTAASVVRCSRRCAGICARHRDRNGDEPAWSEDSRKGRSGEPCSRTRAQKASRGREQNGGADRFDRCGGSNPSKDPNAGPPRHHRGPAGRSWAKCINSAALGTTCEACGRRAAGLRPSGSARRAQAAGVSSSGSSGRGRATPSGSPRTASGSNKT